MNNLYKLNFRCSGRHQLEELNEKLKNLGYSKIGVDCGGEIFIRTSSGNRFAHFFNPYPLEKEYISILDGNEELFLALAAMQDCGPFQFGEVIVVGIEKEHCPHKIIRIDSKEEAIFFHSIGTRVRRATIEEIYRFCENSQKTLYHLLGSKKAKTLKEWQEKFPEVKLVHLRESKK